MKKAMSKPCPCSPDKDLMQCCGRYIFGAENAHTAEALMRSRYSAFALKEISYLMKTVTPVHNEKEIAEWAFQAEFTGLKVLKTNRGLANQFDGTVEYLASFIEAGQAEELHEKAQFKKIQGQWFYLAQ